jgi:hypothetical protein
MFRVTVKGPYIQELWSQYVPHYNLWECKYFQAVTTILSALFPSNYLVSFYILFIATEGSVNKIVSKYTKLKLI